MKKVIFYSWQSTLPNATNRGFIETALDKAIKTIAADDGLEVEPVMDRDIQGLAGSVDIAATIFSKIDQADLFVADVSIIGRVGGKKTPNPNVLIEVGYALKALGPKRVILVLNTAFGKVEDLPFDLRSRACLTYSMSKEEPNRSSERELLSRKLEAQIRSYLASADAQAMVTSTPADLAIAALESGQANRIAILRTALAEILTRLDERSPKKFSEGGSADDLLTSIDLSRLPVVDFARIAAAVATTDDTAAGQEMHQWFGGIFERCRPPRQSGTFSSADFDYYKFLAHELYTILVSKLLAEGRFVMLTQLFRETIPLKGDIIHRSDSFYWDDASQYLDSLSDRSREKRRVSVHADVLNTRHSDGDLSQVSPIYEFASADVFLFYMGGLDTPQSLKGTFKWRPWSSLYLEKTPFFIIRAESEPYAKQLQAVFRAQDLIDLRQHLLSKTELLEHMYSQPWDPPINEAAINRIATR